MRKELKMTLFVSLFSILFLFVGAVDVTGEAYESMKGIHSVKAVFDMRAGSPKSAALLLNLIHQTHRDKQLTEITDKPAFKVVFIGPSVKLISTNRDGFSPEDHKFLDEIAGTVSQMSKDDIRLEICLFAAKIFGVTPDSVLPEIKQVPNGWVSLIAYQAKGFTLVPVY
jgi:intracellular sulfur oxidation DsrE/DsrF family protein